MSGTKKGGLRQNTPDYVEIYDKFAAGNVKGFDVNRYCGDAIYKSKADYQLNYDGRQFKQSLSRMVTKIKAGGAPKAAATPSTQPPAPAPAPSATPAAAAIPKPAATPKPAAKTGSPFAPTNTGSPFASPPLAPPKSPPTPVATHAGIPLSEYEELTANDEYMLELPHHLWFWKDASDNDRLSLIVYLPAGISKADIAPRITESGNQIEIEMVWPSIMTDQRLPLYAGTSGVQFYAAGHVKVVSFRAQVQRIKGGAESNKVYSVFRCNLPTTVEEQFCTYDVPSELAAIKYKVRSRDRTAHTQDAVALSCEMMCQRTNYKDDHDIGEFALDFDSMVI